MGLGSVHHITTAVIGEERGFFVDPKPLSISLKEVKEKTAPVVLRS